MTDAFALLGEPRLPYLDPEGLKERFLRLSGPFHPDRVHNASESERAEANRRFAELNAAHHALREPRDRLLHLLELESGAPPRDIQKIPPGTMDLFVEIGQACREADEFLQKRTETTSPMLKLKQMQSTLAWADRLGGLQRSVKARETELIDELKKLNGVWEAAPAVGDPARAASLPLERLEQVYRAMSYTARWTEQLQERFVRFAM